MAVSMMELADHLLAVPGFVDPVGIHHEFADKDHGQKFDWGAISPDMPVYGEVLEAAADNIHDWGDPNALLTVANGTTGIGFDLLAKMQEKYKSRTRLLVTKKDPVTREVNMTDYTKEILSSGEIQTLEIFDDIGTTGSTTFRLGELAIQLGVEEVRILYIAQRLPLLKYLQDEYGPVYPNRSLTVVSNLPTYSPKDCADHGYCSSGWELIEHGK